MFKFLGGLLQLLHLVKREGEKEREDADRAGRADDMEISEKRSKLIIKVILPPQLFQLKIC